MSNEIGRPKVPRPKKFPDYYIKWKNGELRAVDCMILMDLSKSTFYRMIQEYEYELEWRKEQERQRQKQERKRQLEIIRNNAKNKKAESGG